MKAPYKKAQLKLACEQVLHIGKSPDSSARRETRSASRGFVASRVLLLLALNMELA